MAIAQQEIEAYIAHLQSAGEKPSASRIRDVLSIFSDILDERELSWPDDEAYQALLVKLKAKVGKSPTQIYEAADNGVRYARAFFEAKHEQEGIAPMADTSSEVITVAAQDEAAVPEGGQAKPKRGRKPKPENADRVQVSVYLPRSTYEGIRDLAANSGQGISDILARLAFFFTENNAETLARIREVRRLSLTYSLRED